MNDKKWNILVMCGVVICIVLSIVVVFVAPPTEIETITIGDPGGTIINRTQFVGFDNDSMYIQSEVYTGTISKVESYKIVFEDGYVLIAQKVELFGYKIGSKHIIEVDIFNSGRIVENVYILETSNAYLEGESTSVL